MSQFNGITPDPAAWYHPAHLLTDMRMDARAPLLHDALDAPGFVSLASAWP
ncbi:MAG TPA: hypothetical protein VMF13_04350 [Luteitalea sp.]|nr:hypothetical protein [Luteitalea sp.]